MVLKTVTIKDFLSIRGSITLDVDSRATILLGANDHGKSNILAAIEHLNDGHLIAEDEVNWDASDAGDAPALTYTFALSTTEIAELNALMVDWAMAYSQKITQPSRVADPEEPDDSDEEDDSDESDESDAETDEPTKNSDEPDISEATQFENVTKLRTYIDEGARNIVFSRMGVQGSLSVCGVTVGDLPGEVGDWFDYKRPRVELFRALSGEIQDSVTAGQIAGDDYEFLQGVFFYAGLNPLDCEKLFKQTDSTERALDESSKLLDAELRTLWAQGTALGLHFELRHRGDAIQFLANDPSVQARKTRMSKRSTGVTQFFRISMVLHARRQKHRANSYIYLFDEPGVFLHPQGQKDLMQVFEQLSTEAQVLYTTHSLFLLNQNFPERHRLIIRNEGGTKVDQKPYRANWRLATDALGVYLTSNILFSSRVLLVEGDSDPLYIYELFRHFNHTKALDADANTLGIFSYSDLPNLRFLLQVFKRDNASANVVVLVDGDSQGKSTTGNIRKLCERLGVTVIELEKNKSIEDFIASGDLFLEAIALTVHFALEAVERPSTPEIEGQIKASWTEHCQKPEKNTGRWFKELSKKHVGEEASKVALARNYAFSCREKVNFKTDPLREEKGLNLCKEITKALQLPGVRSLKAIEMPSIGAESAILAPTPKTT